MNMSGNTVLITGGASGIGLAFAERFLAAGNEVIICGRREAKLNEAKGQFPAIHTRVCDVSDPKEREALIASVTSEFKNINVLVNNAGIQQRVNLLKQTSDWSLYQQEIAINLEAPIQLTMLLLPYLLKQEEATVINVSSGLAITPATWVPIYSSTKAGLRAFTKTLRIQLEHTNVGVVEVLPPAVNTDLGGVGLHTFGAPLHEFADSVFQGFAAGELEIGCGGTEERLTASQAQKDEMTQKMWENFLKHNPDFLE